MKLSKRLKRIVKLWGPSTMAQSLVDDAESLEAQIELMKNCHNCLNDHCKQGIHACEGCSYEKKQLWELGR